VRIIEQEPRTDKQFADSAARQFEARMTYADEFEAGMTYADEFEAGMTYAEGVGQFQPSGWSAATTLG